MSFSDNKKFWTEFMNLYREQRALWDVRSKEYSNKHMKRDSYDILVEKCKEITPDANEKFVKSKIESLRASFRRELKIVLKSKNKTGSSHDDVYEPHLWYFDQLLFTSDQETVRKGVSSLGKNSTQPEEERSVDEQLSEEEDETNTELRDTNVAQEFTTDTLGSPGPGQLEQHDLGPSISQQKSSTPHKLKAIHAPLEKPPSGSSRIGPKKTKVSEVEKKKECFLDMATKIMSQQTKSSVFGNNVAFQLEDLDRKQRIFAEKIISDVLFYANLGKLTETASISLGPNSRQGSDTSNNFIHASHSQFSPQGHFPSQQLPMVQSSTLPHYNHQAYQNHYSTQYPNYVTLQNSVPRVEVPYSSSSRSCTTPVDTSCSSVESSNHTAVSDRTVAQDDGYNNTFDEMNELLTFGNQRNTNVKQ